MTSTRDRNGSSATGFGLQDFGALSATDLKHDAAIRLVTPDIHDRVAAQSDAQAASRSHLDGADVQPHAVKAGVSHHTPLAQSQNAVHAGNSDASVNSGGQHVASLDHVQSFIASADHEFVSDSLAEQASFNPTPVANAAFVQSNIVHEANASAHQGEISSGHEIAHAPPPVVNATGQLWFGVDDNAHEGVDHVDSDAAGHDIADLPGTDISSVGLDGADGFYFAMGRDGFLRDGHITNDQEVGTGSQVATTDMVFNNGGSSDEVNAFAVDPINHIVFVGLFDQQDQYTGIAEVRYDPSTGALTNPYNASTGVITDFSHMLFHDDNSGKVNGSVSYSNAIAMQYDMQNGNLYYVDQTNGH